jgi:hypothetical protein
VASHHSASRGPPTASRSQLVELPDDQPVSLPSADGGQLVDQAALLGLEARPGVMGNKTGQPLPAKATKEPGAIHWMEAKPVQRRGIADVMQERRRDQRVTILGREGRRHATRLASDRLDMRPPVAQWRNQPSACAVAQGSRVIA